MNLLLVCGGSAGHINPAIAIAEEIQDRSPESNILFVGADKTLEKRLVPAAGFRLVNIKMSGLRRGISPRDLLHNLKTAKNLVAAGYKSGKILKEFDPNVVIGTGGYICYPVLKKAASSGIPTYILEPNAYPGLAVRMLSGIVDKVFVTYQGLENRYKKPESVIYTGTPLRNEFFRDDAPMAGISAQDQKPLVLSYWGSLGATVMNEKILGFMKRNIKENKFRHIHATGVSSSAETMKKQLLDICITETGAPEDNCSRSVEIREYIDDMPLLMKEADIVISRAGASTIAELTALGKPAILIPSPNVTENHQESNARQLQAAGGAVMILEKDCTGDILFDTVASILEDRKMIVGMSNALKLLAVKDAAAKIAEIVIGEHVPNC